MKLSFGKIRTSQNPKQNTDKDCRSRSEKAIWASASRITRLGKATEDVDGLPLMRLARGASELLVGSVPSRTMTSSEFAQMINSLKFLPKDFTTLRTSVTIFLR